MATSHELVRKCERPRELLKEVITQRMGHCCHPVPRLGKKGFSCMPGTRYMEAFPTRSCVMYSANGKNPPSRREELLLTLGWCVDLRKRGRVRDTTFGLNITSVSRLVLLRSSPYIDAQSSMRSSHQDCSPAFGIIKLLFGCLCPQNGTAALKGFFTRFPRYLHR